MTDTCHHGRNLAWGCSECVLEGKLAALRGEFGELRHELRRRLELSTTLNARLEALTEERNALKAKEAVLTEELRTWRNGHTFQAFQEDCEVEEGRLRNRIAELEKQHESDADMFASGRRYEQAWGEVREANAEDRLVDMDNLLEYERDKRIEAQRLVFSPHVILTEAERLLRTRGADDVLLRDGMVSLNVDEDMVEGASLSEAYEKAAKKDEEESDV